MEIRYQLQHADLVASFQHLQARMRAQRAGIVRLIGAGLLGYFAAMLLHQIGIHYRTWIWMLTGLILLVAVVWGVIWRRAGRYERWLAQFAGEYTLTLSPAGVSLCAPHDRVAFYAWPEIIALETTPANLYFYLRRDVACMIPRAAFADDAAADNFAGEARRLWAAYPVNAGKTMPDAPGLPKLLSAGEILANLRAAARVILFLKFDPLAFRVSRSVLVWLLLAELLWFAAADYVRAFPAPTFSILGLSAFGATTLLTLAGIACISSMLAQRASMLRLLVMAVSASLLIDMVYLPVYTMVEILSPGEHRLLEFLYAWAVLWQMAAMFRIMRRLYRQPVPSALLLVGIYAFFAFALARLLPPLDLYFNVERYGSVASHKPAAKLDEEDVFYRQPDLVGRALNAVARHHPGKPNLYFVGFAGEADEKVFSNEVSYARDLLDRRFYTDGRSLLLLNNTDTVRNTPIANTHNLEAVLQGVAKRMNKQEDVLFLYLSSHGASDHRLSVSFEPLGLDDLKAEKLKRMLDKSGIRNRVIVVSACYSGGFLDVLKDDNSLILTASSRDHVAYGCGDYTTYTFFGEAYFVDSLEHDDSFITAFDDARQIIEAREKSEGMDASRPQIHVGRNIKKVLDKLKVFPPSDKTYSCGNECPGESG